jgi:hypothetical protein
MTSVLIGIIVLIILTGIAGIIMPLLYFAVPFLILIGISYAMGESFKKGWDKTRDAKIKTTVIFKKQTSRAKGEIKRKILNSTIKIKNVLGRAIMRKNVNRTYTYRQTNKGIEKIPAKISLKNKLMNRIKKKNSVI